MEILVFIAIGAVAIWLAYRSLNKEDANGKHPLDALAKDAPYKLETPIVTRTGDIVSTSLPDAVNNQITDSVTQSAPSVTEKAAVKKPRKPRTPKVKVEEKPKKTAVKKAEPPKKSAAMKAPKSKKS